MYQRFSRLQYEWKQQDIYYEEKWVNGDQVVKLILHKITHIKRVQIRKTPNDSKNLDTEILKVV